MAQTFDDANHPVRFDSPLKGDLVVRSMTGEEAMGRLSVFHLELLSQNFELHFKQIVGQKVTVIVDLPEGERYFNGYITEFRFMGQTDRYARYTATLRPWFWFLSRTADCRIFQETTVPDIIKAVFRDNGIADFEDRLTAKYRKWEYCVQYRESDFNFLSRLMEGEGIYYFFEHHKDKHILVLADGINAHVNHVNFPNFDTVPYFPPSGEMSVEQRDHLEYWAATQAIQPGKYAITDFDFKKPKVKLLKKSENLKPHPYLITDPEIFDYPGEYVELSEGDDYVKLRLQELQSQHERVQAGGPCRGLSPGCIFKLEDYPRKDQNKAYIVLSISHQVNGSDYISGSQGAHELYRCQVEVLSKETPFRAARATPKPIVQGPQTAIVVGPASEEIHTEKYGRVKVQFHWDRYGNSDENSSCWIRVSQAWAGEKWGGIHIPRIGQEVIVSFMEGDPDRPIITGRVYNEDCMPPYDLEANKTQSGIKSRSTKGGGPGNFNEIRMEDKIGNEELYIQAEKNENILVKNDKGETVGHNETINIGNDRTETVGHDETRTVGHDETVTVGNNRLETVMVDETLNVMNNRTRNVAKNENVTVTMMRTHTVGINEAITIGAAQEITVGGLQEIAVGGMQSMDVGLARDISVGRNQSHDIGKDWTVNVGGKNEFKIDKELVMDAGDSITFKTGSASIVMKKDGTITIKGKDITLKASGKITGKASGNVKIKGSSVGDN